MPVHLAECPLTCVAVGSGRSLEEFEAIHRASQAARTPQQPPPLPGPDSRHAAGLRLTLGRSRASQPHRTVGGAGLVRPALRPPGRSPSRVPARSSAGSSSGVLVLLSLVLITRLLPLPTGGGLHGVQSVGATVLRPFEVARRTASRGRSATPYGWFARPRPRASRRTRELRAEIERAAAAGDPERERGRRERRPASSSLNYAARRASRRTTTPSRRRSSRRPPSVRRSRSAIAAGSSDGVAQARRS